MGAIVSYKPSDLERERQRELRLRELSDTKPFRAQDHDPEKSLRRLQGQLAAAMRRLSKIDGIPLPVGGGTQFSGAEVLASMSAAGTAVANTVTETSLLTRECVIPFAPQYFGRAGQHFRITAHGIISTTATPTILFKLKMDTAYNATAIAGATIAGSNKNAALTTGSGLANVDWIIEILGVVRVPGATGTVLAVGSLVSNIVSTTDDYRVISNATPPTAVAENLSLSQFVDISATWGTANASNTLLANDYVFESLN